MGGGPDEGEEEFSSPEVTVPSYPQVPSASPQVFTATRVEHQVPSYPRVPSVTATQVNVVEHQERPVLTTAFTGGLIGALAGSWVGGMGSMVGTTVGVIAGASIASRDDAIGAQARDATTSLKRTVETGVTRAVERLNQEPLGRDITAKLSSAVQVLTETSERYRVNQRIDAAAAKFVEVAEPKVRAVVAHVVQKVNDVDQHGYVDRATNAWKEVDRTLGISRGVDALNRELRN